ncbi:hypothetical protein BFD37_13445 [Escherichia coli]|nr:hypothetical protein BFD37_13445 [Escherichia coli]ROK25198.1 hypothetical protein BFD47_16545 [Escherichia coli]
MPIYEQDPKELLGEDIQQIAAPDDSNFYMETPSLLSAVNPFTSDQRVQRSRQAAFRIDNTLGSFIASAPFSQFDRWICPYISRHLLSLNPLLACCRRYSRGER